ncbi:transporter [Thiohalophilus thiocyanatoxydans]|uniref:Transporter n=1 Tax=Thiohalophilus thiocyanatoxydans TaxID=381308 RepID=A0A4R8IVF2_9GAMM|nr:transporter [Thiohalophilus thiocyanatoxydans]TDY01747.1 hypothetical protein EDC23_1638 [Thiohalophilus thiocyanatoxydans]
MWRMNGRRHYVAVIMLTVALFPRVLFAETEFSLSAGIDYTTGDYGQQADTDMVYLPFTARYKTDAYNLWLTAPYLMVDGPGGVTRAQGPVRHTGTQTTSTESGLGDVITGLSYGVYVDARQGLLVDVTGKIKFSTADEARGLGTGENDYSLQVDLYQSWKQYTLIATLGYTLVGDPPDINLDNRTYHSFGLAGKLSEKTQAGILYDVSGPAFDFDYDREELFGYISQRLDRRQKIQYYALYGLETASPDVGFGVILTYMFI